MSWVATAIAGSAIIGGVVSSRNASQATDAASDASEAQIAFEREKYDDWNEVYGPVQDNLANYYNNVTPEYYAAVGLEKFQQEYETSMARLDQNLAQRGIDPSSGIAMSLESQGELDAAETRATIRRDAPQQAAEDKSRFLQIGLGQNPGSSLSSALSDSSRISAANAQNAQNASGEAWGAAIPAVGRAIDAYTNRPVTPSNTGGTLMTGNPTNPSILPGEVYS